MGYKESHEQYGYDWCHRNTDKQAHANKEQWGVREQYKRFVSWQVTGFLLNSKIYTCVKGCFYVRIIFAKA